MGLQNSREVSSMDIKGKKKKKKHEKENKRKKWLKYILGIYFLRMQPIAEVASHKVPAAVVLSWKTC